MATITLDAYYTRYTEQSDLDYSWTEQGTNLYGLNSHSLKPGYGAQWDPNRVEQFLQGGIEAVPDFSASIRRLPFMGMEGPHETFVSLAFRIPLPNTTTCTSAYIKITDMGGTTSNIGLRLFGVVADNFTSQFDGVYYPRVYRCEWLQSHFPPVRGYLGESLEKDQQHTVQEVTWTAPSQAGTTFNSPDISNMINEVIKRPNWKSNNVMAFILAQALFPPGYITPFAPNMESYDSGSYAKIGDVKSLTRPQLIINY